MKITEALINKLIALRDGESVAASSLKYDWVDELISEHVIISSSRGSKRLLSVLDKDAFLVSLAQLHEGLDDLDRMLSFCQGEALRAEQAAQTGNSKLRTNRSFPGFLVNCYEPIECNINDSVTILSPVEGSGIFVFDWKKFSIPEDVVVVGIENPENFRFIRSQRYLFEANIPNKRFLFVSRYPQSKDLRDWLVGIPNHYVHFGDFDLAGIRIFLTEFNQHIPDRSSLLIPSDIEDRLSRLGSSERFTDQYNNFKNLHSDIHEIEELISLIMKYHRCYDQEGYIGN
ncbi:MAG: hypothetical protein MJZ41_09625 [Bacteroidaceae bacterium]|nr:hypothetical protein [Bacteroidaceae bacterium]